MKSLHRLAAPLPRTLCLVAGLAALATTTTMNVRAGEPEMSGKDAVVIPEDPAPWLHGLFQLDVSDHYITPRGLNVENEGVIFQPLALLFVDLYSEPDAFLNSVSMTLGIWNSIHTEESGADPGNWNELDPIFGLTFKFADKFQLDTNFTRFESMVDSYPTSSHMEIKLSYDDSDLFGPFALHPWVAYWLELENKSTVVFDPSRSSESFYFTLGVAPSFNIGKVKFEFPNFINLVDDDFYQQIDGSPGGSGLAVFCSSVKASVPLDFIPKNMGFWTFYAGVKYYHLNNDGLRDGNSVLTPREHKDDLVQFHTGISIFF